MNKMNEFYFNVMKYSSVSIFAIILLLFPKFFLSFLSYKKVFNLGLQNWKEILGSIISCAPKPYNLVYKYDRNFNFLAKNNFYN